MKEKVFSLSGDSFSVKDANGQVVVKVSGKAFGFGDKKNVEDPLGKPLYQLRTKLIAIHKTYIATSLVNDTELFTVKSKFALGGSKAMVTFKNAADGHEMELTLRGNILDSHASIVLGDRPVATISRQILNAREAFQDKQSYYVTVAPGVDLSLIAGVAVCFDEMEHDSK